MPPAGLEESRSTVPDCLRTVVGRPLGRVTTVRPGRVSKSDGFERSENA